MRTSGKVITRKPAKADYADIPYHVTKLRVPLFEVDLGQAVYHGNYYHLFELAREDFLKEIGFPYREFMNRQLHLAVVEAQCTYRRPLHYDDVIYIHTGIARITSRSLSFSQIVFRETGEGEKEITTSALLQAVCVRFSGGSVQLPEEFRSAVERYHMRRF